MQYLCVCPQWQSPGLVLRLTHSPAHLLQRRWRHCHLEHGCDAARGDWCNTNPTYKLNCNTLSRESYESCLLCFRFVNYWRTHPSINQWRVTRLAKCFLIIQNVSLASRPLPVFPDRNNATLLGWDRVFIYPESHSFSLSIIVFCSTLLFVLNSHLSFIFWVIGYVEADTPEGEL